MAFTQHTADASAYAGQVSNAREYVLKTDIRQTMFVLIEAEPPDIAHTGEKGSDGDGRHARVPMVLLLRVQKRYGAARRREGR